MVTTSIKGWSQKELFSAKIKEYRKPLNRQIACHMGLTHEADYHNNLGKAKIVIDTEQL